MSSNPSTSSVGQLLGRLNDPDPDFRFMALSDLQIIFKNARPDWLAHDYNTSARFVDGIVKALGDQVGEVQNLAIKCLGPFSNKCPISMIAPLLEKLSTLKLEDSVDQSIPSMALKTVINGLPKPQPGGPPSTEAATAYTSVSRVLLPRFLGQTARAPPTKIRLPDPPSTTLLSDSSFLSPDTLDVLVEVVACFGSMMSSAEVEALLNNVVALVESTRATSAVRKRAVVAISLLVPYISEQSLEKFISHVASTMSQPNIDSGTRRHFLTVMGSIARSIPTRAGRFFKQLTPIVLQALGDEELAQQMALISEGEDSDPQFGDVREAALVALESFLSSCPKEMRPFTDDTISASLRYLKYNPNMNMDDDEDDDMGEDDDEDASSDDEFDDDGAFDDDDDDDGSWRVRRASAKVLYTLISTRGSGDLLDSGVFYDQAAMALIKRLDEPEETVRLEVISTLALLIRKTGGGMVVPSSGEDDGQLEMLSRLPQTRKRRRESSSGAFSIDPNSATRAMLSRTGVLSPETEKIPSSGPQAELARLTPALIKSTSKLFKGKALATKQALFALLTDLVSVQRSGLSSYLDQIIGPLVDAIKVEGLPSTSAGLAGATSATPTTFRISALHLAAGIARTHSAHLLEPYLTKLVGAVVAAVNDNFFKIASEALKTSEEIVKAITPPRSSKTCQKYKAELLQLFDVICEQAVSNTADSEVRQRAIHALGTALARTSNPDGASLLSPDQRKAALEGLSAKIQNEITQVPVIKAIGNIAFFASPIIPLDQAWAQNVASELAAQLRKSNRILVSASIQTLSHLVNAPGVKGNIDSGTVTVIVSALLPIFKSDEALLVGPTANILANLAEKDAAIVASNETNEIIVQLLLGKVPRVALDSIVQLVATLGQGGHGKALMQDILQKVSVNGDTAVTGKVIGALMVASGSSTGVSLDSFAIEVKRGEYAEPARACLALNILGESGLRLGTQNTIKPSFFLGFFHPQPDKVSIASAIALGRAGAGNVQQYLPAITANMGQGGTTEYLLLQAIKEMLQVLSNSQNVGNYGSHWPTIWDHSVKAMATEDNRPACAECIGRLTIIEPQTFLVKLQELIKSESTVVRTVALQALRYTLLETDDAFDGLLKASLVDILLKILKDPDMEIRRVALSVLTSAVHNKPDLVGPSLGQLMPFVLKETVKNMELVHEVSLGPFKHQVDDGLELRKSAYETLYALMETAFSCINVTELFDRVVAGLSDDGDIRALCNLMLAKLVIIDFDETVRRLDAIAIAYQAILSVKLKENAVRQEVEKQEEAIKSVLRMTVLLEDKTKGVITPGNTGQVGQQWLKYLDFAKSTFKNQLSTIRGESRSKASNTGK